jgi:hypothetical protein
LLWRRGGLCDLTGFSDIDFEPVASKLDLCRDGACAVAYALLLQDINPTVVCTSLLASHVSRVLPSHWCICSCHFRTNTVHVFLPAALHCSSHMRVVSRNTRHHVLTSRAFSHAHEVTISQIHQRKRADDERRFTRNAQSNTEMTYIVILPKHRPSSHE